MIHGCEKCFKMVGIIFLALGILFLLQDQGIWNFWNISWYTALFLVAGVIHLSSGQCPECKTSKSGKK